jgi:hypothetical protein
MEQHQRIIHSEDATAVTRDVSIVTPKKEKAKATTPDHTLPLEKANYNTGWTPVCIARVQAERLLTSLDQRGSNHSRLGERGQAQGHMRLLWENMRTLRLH